MKTVPGNREFRLDAARKSYRVRVDFTLAQQIEGIHTEFPRGDKPRRLLSLPEHVKGTDLKPVRH
jgi:hypothetical protein